MTEIEELRALEKNLAREGLFYYAFPNSDAAEEGLVKAESLKGKYLWTRGLDLLGLSASDWCDLFETYINLHDEGLSFENPCYLTFYENPGNNNIVLDITRSCPSRYYQEEKPENLIGVSQLEGSPDWEPSSEWCPGYYTEILIDFVEWIAGDIYPDIWTSRGNYFYGER